MRDLSRRIGFQRTAQASISQNLRLALEKTRASRTLFVQPSAY